jgi:hypothetical protein
MAGEIRQPIDIPALERYIEKHVPAIEIPLQAQQVDAPPIKSSSNAVQSPSHTARPQSTDPPSSLLHLVRLRTIQPNLPAHLRQWPEVRYAQEASWRTPLKDGTPGRARIPYHPRTGEVRRPRTQDILSLRGCQRGRDTLLHHGIYGWEDRDGCLVPRRQRGTQDGDVMLHLSLSPNYILSFVLNFVPERNSKRKRKSQGSHNS